MAEALEPAARGEVVDLAGRDGVDPLQHIDQIGVAVDAMGTASGQQRLDDRDLLSAHLGRTEQPVTPAHRYDAQRPLEVVGIQRQPSVIQELSQSLFALARIAQGLGQWALGQQGRVLDARLDPLEEPINDLRTFVAAHLQDRGRIGRLFAQLLLDAVQRPDHLQALLRHFGLARLGLDQRSPGVSPAKRMHAVRRGCGIARVHVVAVGLQRTLPARAEDALERVRPAGGRVHEGDVTVLAQHRPQPPGLHLALAGLGLRVPGLDRRLVDLQVRVIDHQPLQGGGHRREQADRALGPQIQRRARQRDPLIGQTLMLTVQRAVIDELVHQHPGQQAHVDLGVIEHAQRRGRRGQLPVALVPHHRPLVAQHHVAAGLARQPQALLDADHLVLIGVRPLQLGARQLDRAHRHVRAEAQPRVVDLLARAVLAPRVRRHHHRRGGLGALGRHRREQRDLLGRQVLSGTLLGGRPEQLPLEPLQALAQLRVLRRQRIQALLHDVRVGSAGKHLGHSGIVADDDARGGNSKRFLWRSEARSIPSSHIINCVSVIVTAACADDHGAKRPVSKRFAQTQKPPRVQYRIFTIVPARFTYAYRSPDTGSWPSERRVSAISPSKLLRMSAGCVDTNTRTPIGSVAISAARSRSTRPRPGPAARARPHARRSARPSQPQVSAGRTVSRSDLPASLCARSGAGTSA